MSNKFTPPEQSEVELYFSKIGLPIEEVGRYMDHYESCGWMVGRKPMKNWQAAARNWKRNFYERNFYGRKPATENHRNTHVAVAGPDGDELGKLKLQKQNEARDRKLQAKLDQQTLGFGPSPS